MRSDRKVRSDCFFGSWEQTRTVVLFSTGSNGIEFMERGNIRWMLFSQLIKQASIPQSEFLGVSV